MPAVAQFQIQDIQTLHLSGGGGVGHENCTSSPNSVSAPGWEWQWNSNPLCLWIDSGLVTSPSLDNQALKFEWCWGTSCAGNTTGYGGALFHSSLNTVSDTTDTEFTWGGWFYYTDASTIDNIELDMNQVVSDPGQVNNTATVIYAAQCDLTTTPSHWEFVNGWLITSNILCPRSQWTNNTWHHIVIHASRTATCTHLSCTLTYYSVSFDGNTQNCSGTCTSASNKGAYALGWGTLGELVENVQFGVTNSANGSNIAYADLMTTHAGAPTIVAMPTFTPAGGSYGSTQSVTISTVTGGSPAICYTTDSSTPTANGGGGCTHGSIYSTPVLVSSSETLKAVSSEDGIDFDSVVGSAAYTIGGGTHHRIITMN